MTRHHRCAWADHDALMRAYHDDEWGVPQYDSRMLWEILMLEGFQAGLAWIIVLRKREAFRKAFAGFNPPKVARFTKKDIDRLMHDASIIRARAKIEATIRGAQIFCEMEEAGETFTEFCWAFTDGKVVKGDGRKWMAQIGFNDRDVRLFRILERRTLNRGQQRITFETTAVPADWGRRGDFGLMVNMGPSKSSPSWTPTASSVQPLPVKP